MDSSKLSVEEQYSYLMTNLDALSFSLNYQSSSAELFLESRCDFLVNNETLNEYTIVNYNKDNNTRIDAWGITPSSDEDNIYLAIILSDFRDEDTVVTEPLCDFRTFLAQGRRFLNNVLKDNFRVQLPIGSPVRGFADYIKENKEKIVNIRLIGLTNMQITSRSSLVITEAPSLSDFSFSFDIWDLCRLVKIDLSSSGQESVDIDFVHDYNMPYGIPALKPETGCDIVDSYIFVLPGKALFEMYSTYNEKMLEQNPRTFLQFGRKVNKGIKKTILDKPDMFFSYNNGISAVSNGVEYNESSGCITSITNFQIVNGGQTTASIYNTYLKAINSKTSIAINKIFVMVKLSVIKDYEQVEDVIASISEYSNTQNRIDSSLFSNRHILHKKIEAFSRNVWAPSNGGRYKETHWYYERVLGQYKNAINLCKTSKEKKDFEERYPKEQMFTTTDLAKYVMAYKQQPYNVCLGKQKCYAVFCSQFLTKEEIDITEQDFKDICCLALIFKSLEKRIRNDVKLVIVPYVISCIVKNLEDNNKKIDFDALWRAQFNSPIFDIMNTYVPALIGVITRSKESDLQLLSEWGKKLACWENVKETKLDVSLLFPYCVPLNYKKPVEKQSEAAVVDNVIQYVKNKGASYWKAVYFWVNGHMNITEIGLSMLKKGFEHNSLLSQPICRVIKEIEREAIAKGFKFNDNVIPVSNTVNSGEKVDILTLVKEDGHEVIDKRQVGGSLWVIGGLSLSPFFKKYEKYGYYFRYNEKGGRSTNYRSAWWIQ